jgi:hypothetical protein
MWEGGFRTIAYGEYLIALIDTDQRQARQTPLLVEKGDDEAAAALIVA